jgi:Asp-tRNA(Asn)/Glu-tRNA(Gln) amidotransferase C subunit
MDKKAFDKDVIMSQLDKIFVFAEVFKKLDKDNLDITYDNVSNIIINTFLF